MELDLIAFFLVILGLGVGVFLGVLYTSQNLYWRGYEVTWIIINDFNALLSQFRMDESGGTETQVDIVAAAGKVITQATCSLNLSQPFLYTNPDQEVDDSSTMYY